MNHWCLLHYQTFLWFFCTPDIFRIKYIHVLRTESINRFDFIVDLPVYKNQCMKLRQLFISLLNYQFLCCSIHLKPRVALYRLSPFMMSQNSTMMTSSQEILLAWLLYFVTVRFWLDTVSPKQRSGAYRFIQIHVRTCFLENTYNKT